MLISVEVYQDDQVFVRLDQEGLSRLRKALDQLDHVDEVGLLSSAWDGEDLTEVSPSVDRSPVHHLRFFLADRQPANDW